MKKLTLREKSILAGLYLSKFDFEGLKYLGFDSFTEASNVIGLALGVQPASVKNFREKPYHQLYRDPIESLKFNKIKNRVIQISWNTAV